MGRSTTAALSERGYMLAADWTFAPVAVHRSNRLGFSSIPY
jgi:hypothetical protein